MGEAVRTTYAFEPALRSLFRRLRLALDGQQLFDNPWFWWAEVGVAWRGKDRVEWCPLVFRLPQARGKWQVVWDIGREPWGGMWPAEDHPLQYQRFFNRVTSPQGRGGSLLEPLLELLRSRDSGDALVPKVRVYHELSDLEAQAFRDFMPEWLVYGRFLLDVACKRVGSYSRKQFDADIEGYRSEVMQVDWCGDHRIYPENPYLFGLPMLDPADGVDRFLGLLVLCVDAGEKERRPALIRSLALSMRSLQHDATALALESDVSDLVGLVRADGPVRSVEHPALTIAEYRDSVACRGEAHESFESFGLDLALKGKKGVRPNGRRVLEVLRRTTRYAAESVDAEQGTALLLRRHGAEEGCGPLCPKCAGKSGRLAAVEAAQAELQLDSIHRWIKAVYGETVSGQHLAGSEKYELLLEHVAWLAALLRVAAGTCHPCSLVQHERENSLSPFGRTGFHFPVSPGWHFLVPLLELLEWLPWKLGDLTDCAVSSTLEILRPKPPTDAVRSAPIAAEIAAHGRCGIVLEVGVIGAAACAAWDQKAMAPLEGWRCNLVSSQRRGADAEYFLRVKECAPRPRGVVRRDVLREMLGTQARVSCALTPSPSEGEQAHCQLVFAWE